MNMGLCEIAFHTGPFVFPGYRIERSGSGIDLRPALRTFPCPRRKDISTLTAGNGLIRTQGSAAGHTVRRSYRISCRTVITGQPAQSLREIEGKTEGLSGLRDRLPDPCCELQGSDILGEVVYSARKRPGTAQRHERRHAQTGSDTKPFLLSQLDMNAILHFG